MNEVAVAKEYYKKNEPAVYAKLIQIEAILNRYAANLIAGNNSDGFGHVVSIYHVLKEDK